MMRFVCLLALVIPGLVGVHAQVTTVDCDQMGLVVNVGSDPGYVNLYHPGGYLTWPQTENVMAWEFSDAAGEVLLDTVLFNENFVPFNHSVALTDTIFVSVLLTNDSAMHNGSPVACIIEDFLTWQETEIVPGTFVGSWTLGGSVGAYAGEAAGVGGSFAVNAPRQLVRVMDFTGRAVQPAPNRVLIYVYSDGTVEKRYFID